ncbi:MAG: ABC transporter permease [Pseudomonadota bacterium]
MAPPTSAKPVKQPFSVAVAAFMELVYALVVRELRSEHKNAALGILLNIGPMLVMGLVFYFIITMLGGGMAKIRGDHMTFILIGFAVFFGHIQTVTAVSGSVNAGMLNHKRMSLFLMICVKSLSILYKNILSFGTLLAMNYLFRDVWHMDNPLLFITAFIWSWIGGVAVGVMILAAQRYFSWGSMLKTVYVRIMFFTSGKLFVANTLPGFIRWTMDWNPLYHLLDQARSAAFLNYTAHTTTLGYPVMVICILVVFAALIENYVRVNFSASHAPG